VAALELQVGAVIALMLASGQALEDYGVRQGEAATPTSVEEIVLGSVVLVRHGEMLPLGPDEANRMASCRVTERWLTSLR
jgi:hypothetical protein